jgi:outer membrane protein OmpA-like peptidoglycan-associated protein
MKPRKFTRSGTAATLAVTLLGEAVAQNAADSSNISAPPPSSAPSIPLSYVGTNARVGISVNQDGDVQGEALGVLGYNGARAFVVEGWLGDGGGGGAQAGYHWLWDGRTREDTMHRSSLITVAKVFAAADQNGFGDRKATIGMGFERQQFALDLYYAHALTDERLISSANVDSVEHLTGDENGRPFRQDVAVATLTEQFEHPYTHGVGARLGHFFEPSLLRIRGGFDYEVGTALLAGQKANQFSLTLELDKHLYNSGHSVGVELTQQLKDGPFDSPAFGGDRDNTRAALHWRYEFGQSFRPAQMHREHTVTHTVEVPAPPPQTRRIEMPLASQALFEFNRSEVTVAARASLRPVIDDIRRRRVGTISIVGHTCDLGSDEYNQRLSERRAQALRDWFIAEGIPADALEASGRGESEPQYPNDSEENRAKNRRIVLNFSVQDEIVIRGEATTRTTQEIIREPIPTPAAWIERALRSPSEHKRTVDTYHVERVTETRTPGPREFINRAPTARDDALSTNHDVAVTRNVLANDVDLDGDVLQITAVGTPAHGRVTLNADRTITYTPDPGFIGTDSFTYTIRDAQGLTATATATVAVVNQAPIAVDDVAQAAPDSQPTIINVLANDSDPEDGPLTLVIARAPAGGTATVNANRTVTYTPNNGFSGADTFTYTIREPQGATATATVTVNVANQTPVAVNDSAQARANNQPITINVLANDSDPEGGQLTVTIAGAPAGGAASVNPDGTITYTPNDGFGGVDTFTYTIREPHGATATATVTVNVVNLAPVAVNDTTQAPANNQPITIDVLANDSDAEDGRLTVTVGGQPAGGAASVNPDGTIAYTPNAGFSGVDTFTYTIRDPIGATASATVTVNVVNLPPVANDDTDSAPDAPITINVLTNDFDPEGGPLIVTVMTQPASGTATANPDGTITYSPVLNVFGTFTFTYMIRDALGLTDTATVTVDNFSN